MKKSLPVLTLFLFLSFSAISQSDTVVVLTQRQAREVVKDLSSLDYLKQMEEISMRKITLLEAEIARKDTLVLYKDKQIINLNRVIKSHEDFLRMANQDLQAAFKQTEDMQKQRNFMAGMSTFFLVLLIAL